MGYPSSIDSVPGTATSGTTLLADGVMQHSLQHRTYGSAILGIENALGTTNGTAVIAGFSAGQAALPIQTGTLGTAIVFGTFNNLIGTTPSLTGGTANGMTLGTPTIGSIAVPGTTNALGFTAAIAPEQGSVADSPSGTITVNAQQAQIYYCVLGTTAGNRTIAAPQNPSPYQQLTFAVQNSGSANGTLVWNSVFRFSQNIGTATLGTANTWNYYTFRYNSISTKWDFQGQVVNLT